MTLPSPKLVRITRDMRPWQSGQDALLPADVADRLIAEGAAENPRDRFGNRMTEDGGQRTEAPAPEQSAASATAEARTPKAKYRTKRD
jgi:hypothetical protein